MSYYASVDLILQRRRLKTEERIEITILLACELFYVSKELLMSKSRKRHAVEARHICMYVFRKQLKMPLHKIGELLNRDHASVIHGVKNVENLLKSDDSFSDKAKHILKY